MKTTQELKEEFRDDMLGDESPEPHMGKPYTKEDLTDEKETKDAEENQSQETYESVMNSIENRLKIALAPDMKLVRQKLDEIDRLVAQLKRMLG